MKIIWTICTSYEHAKNHSRIIYLHAWNNKPFYWGKAHNSFFGGGKRRLGDLFASGRYNSGYRHWIEGCLQHGAQLYIGQLDKEALDNIDEVENFLIFMYGHVMNTKVRQPKRQLDIEHAGSIPAFILRTTSIPQNPSSI